MKITYRKITASKNEEHGQYVVDTPIPTDPASISRHEQDRIAREIADEEDAYDLEHDEGIYSCGDINAASSVQDQIYDIEYKIAYIKEELERGVLTPDEEVDQRAHLAELEEEVDKLYDQDAEEWRNSLVTSTDVRCNTNVTASTIVPNKKIQPGLQFNRDGHRMKVASRSGNTCIITEDWIAEDTGEPVHISEKYIIAPDPGHGEFCYRPEDKKYAFNSSQPDGYSWWARLYATGADNYPWDWGNLDGEEEESADYADDEEDDYTPSATRGDYGPSNPWDAPGMSMSDFI